MRSKISIANFIVASCPLLGVEAGGECVSYTSLMSFHM